MTGPFELAMDGWHSADHGAEELRHTTTFLSVKVHGKPLVRALDTWSDTVRDGARLPMYPLALWLAGNWWRLRWETTPAKRTSDWRLSHELAAAGHGFLWPPLCFESDGFSVDVGPVAGVVAGATDADGDAVRWMGGRRATVPAAAFEAGVERFVGSVMARLDAKGLGETALAALWRAVTEERQQKEATLWRVLEARLGVDPDEGPPGLVEAFHAQVSSLGEEFMGEFASACAGAASGALLTLLEQAGAQGGVEATLPATRWLRDEAGDASAEAPWDRGRRTAQAARKHLGLPANARMGNALLADLLGISAPALETATSDAALPAALGVKQDRHATRILFRRAAPLLRRFEAARFIGDDVGQAAAGGWLLCSDAKSARQKFQRAFGAELLCPMEGLLQHLGDDVSDAALTEAAGHFEVSPLTVRSQLVNHGYLPRDALF